MDDLAFEVDGARRCSRTRDRRLARALTTPRRAAGERSIAIAACGGASGTKASLAAVSSAELVGRQVEVGGLDVAPQLLDRARAGSRRRAGARSATRVTPAPAWRRAPRRFAWRPRSPASRARCSREAQRVERARRVRRQVVGVVAPTEQSLGERAVRDDESLVRLRVGHVAALTIGSPPQQAVFAPGSTAPGDRDGAPDAQRAAGSRSRRRGRRVPRPASSRMPAICDASGTAGFGQCSWYRSMRSTPSRSADSRAWSTTVDAVGIVGVIFVATNASARRPAIVRPTIISLTPRAYTSAVSIRLTPESSAAWTRSTAVCCAYSLP